MTQSFGAYFAVLRDDRGWTKTELSGAAALQQMEAAILGPLLGWFIDRFGPQGVIRAGVVMFGIGFMLLSYIDSLLAFYGAFVVIALGASLCGFFPLNVALIHWFERYRARALSSLPIGIALGGLTVPLVAWSLATYGWRATAFASGIITIVGRPAALDGHSGAARRTTAKWSRRNRFAPGGRKACRGRNRSARDFTAREALRTPAFWLLSLGHGFALFVVHAVNVHAITHMKEGLGYTIEAASFVIMLLTLVAARRRGDRLADRRPLRQAPPLRRLHAGPHGRAAASSPTRRGAAMIVAFAVLHGTAWGLRGPFMQAIRADYFGRSAIGMILGLSFMIIVIGQIGGPMIAGILADMTGNYRAGIHHARAARRPGVALLLLCAKA